MNNVTATELLTINATNNQVHVVIKGKTNIKDTLVQSDANIKVESDATVEKITVDATGAGAQINNEGTITDLEANGDVEISGKEPGTVTSDTDVDVSKKVSSVEALKLELTNDKVTKIIIEGTIGSDDRKDGYTIYNVGRAVTIKGGVNAKVYGTFIVKVDDVTIDNLTIQNKGDLDGESSKNRGGIYVFAENVTLTNNTITNGLGEAAGLSNAIQIMSSKKDNPLSNYVITGNNIIGHENEVTNWSSSGIVIAQNYTPGSIGNYVQAITATETDYQNLLDNNKFENNKIDLTHQDWSKSGDNVVLYSYPVEDTKEAEEQLKSDFAKAAEKSLENITVDEEIVTYAYNADTKEATITIVKEEISVKDVSGTGAIVALESLVNTEGLKGFQVNGGNDRKDITSLTQTQLKEAIIFEMAAAIALPDGASLNKLGQLKETTVEIKVYLENEDGTVAEDIYKISFK
ncbi:hypothetical protein [Clostridium sp. Cult3]|uniref:hypothetical protein n=1 Tax=Clostridium sp. Cult3 TaxID=2079004 RepID=UPI001F3CFE13|nr:hypothetical protein [Clostridium sp. Cult3]MCF6459520.1 hypothetical protein [Clostridium sp. Cult3]